MLLKSCADSDWRLEFSGRKPRKESRDNLNYEKRGHRKRNSNSEDYYGGFGAKKSLDEVPYRRVVIDERNYSNVRDSRLICASTGTSKSLILGRRFTDEESDQDDEFFCYAEATGSLLVKDRDNFASEMQSRKSVEINEDNEDKKKCYEKLNSSITRSIGNKITDSLPKFRESIFPNVPPYVLFHSSSKVSGKRSSLMVKKNFAKFMIWKSTPSMPPIVQRIIEDSGFHLRKCRSDWSGTWDRIFPKNFQSLKFDKKVNHFPGTGLKLGRKDELCSSINSMAKKFGKKYFNFAPETFILPRERTAFIAAWKNLNKDNDLRNFKWIVKPPCSAGGTGVHVVSQWWEVPVNSYLIIQRYLSHPLLINGAKFDVRLYVLVTSFDPLKVYLYSDGLVRIATAKYNPDEKYDRDKFMHLTNTSVNKYNNNYSTDDHLWPLKTLWKVFEKNSINVKKLWNQMKDIILKTFVSVEDTIGKIVRKNLSSRYTCFELFGFDILIEDDLRPWLLEVNTAPSLRTDSPVHRKVKNPLVESLLNIAGFQYPKYISDSIIDGLSTRYKNPLLSTNFYIYDKTLAHRATRKQFNYSYRFKSDDHYSQSDAIIDELTPDDVRLLVIFEDELTQLELFEKIFPTPETHRYLKFFSGPGYYDLLLDAWERTYGYSRSSGILRLKNLCDKNYHLMP